MKGSFVSFFQFSRKKLRRLQLADFPSSIMSTKFLWMDEFGKIFLGIVFPPSGVIW